MAAGGEDREGGERRPDLVAEEFAEDLAEDAGALWRRALFVRAKHLAAWKQARRAKRVPKVLVRGVDAVEMVPVAVVWTDGLAYIGNVVAVEPPLFRVHYPGSLSAEDEWIHRDSVRWVGYICADKSVLRDLDAAVATYSAALAPEASASKATTPTPTSSVDAKSAAAAATTADSMH
jgi:hypothetical protein